MKDENLLNVTTTNYYYLIVMKRKPPTKIVKFHERLNKEDSLTGCSDHTYPRPDCDRDRVPGVLGQDRR